MGNMVQIKDNNEQRTFWHHHLKTAFIPFFFVCVVCVCVIFLLCEEKK